MADYVALQDGMTYAQVLGRLGPGTEVARTTIGTETTVAYRWQGPGPTVIQVMFQNGRVVSKAQAGLR